MRPWNRLHPPRWKPPPGVMSCEEIRWWMLELHRRGWNRGVMQRTLGMHHHDLRKAYGKDWIYPTEQVRFSRQLKKIISGELVLKARTLRGHRSTKGQPATKRGFDAVLAENPQPLRMPMKMGFDMKTGRIKLTPQFMPPENPLPNFKKIWERTSVNAWPE